MSRLRGPALYPTAAERWLKETGYVRPDDVPWTQPWHGRSRQTRDGRLKTLRLLQEAYPGKRVNEFTSDDLVTWLVQGRQADGRPWSDATVRTRRSTLQSFFEWASDPDVDLVARNPAVRLGKKVPRRGGGGKVHNWLTGPEVQALLATCDEGPLGVRDRVVIELLVNTGLRASEAAGLRWSQVNLFAGTIQLVGKGAKPATIPLLESVAAALRLWRARYVEGLGAEPLHHPVLVSCKHRLHHGMRVGEPGRVEVLWGVPISAHGIGVIVRRRGALIGRPTLAPHDLRRTFAGLLEVAGVPIQEVSWRLRHTSVATTEVYLRDNPLRFQGAQAVRSLY